MEHWKGVTVAIMQVFSEMSFGKCSIGLTRMGKISGKRTRERLELFWDEMSVHWPEELDSNAERRWGNDEGESRRV